LRQLIATSSPLREENREQSRADSPFGYTTLMSTAPICRVVRPGDSYVGRQGLTYIDGLTGASAGARGICMTVATLPPGARAKAHLHHDIETAVYVIDGAASTYFGGRLENVVLAKAGEYVYIPPDVPHLVLNESSAVCRALVAHTAADDQAGIVLLPELDSLVRS
jgi:uncharacterized RmlC-like cupin family protein